MSGKAAKVLVSEWQWTILEEFRRSKTEPRSVSERAAIIVGAFHGRSQLRIHRSLVFTLQYRSALAVN